MMRPLSFLANGFIRRAVLLKTLFEKIEGFFTDAAIGAQPILGHIGPERTRRHAVLGIALGLIVNMPAHDTLPLRHLYDHLDMLVLKRPDWPVNKMRAGTVQLAQLLIAPLRMFAH